MNQQAGEAVGEGAAALVGSRPLHFWVQPRRDGAELKWDIDDNPDPAPKQKKVIYLEDGSGQRKIVFHLQDPEKLGLKFNRDNPIYAKDNVDCQGLTAAIESDQIPKAEIDCQPKKLTITNINSGKARLIRYQLNFCYADDSDAPACDPVILNGGGGGENP